MALAWLAVTPLWLGGGLTDGLAPLLLVVMMFTPATAALIVVLVIARGAAPLKRLGIRPFRPARRTILLSVLGLVGSILLVALGAAASAVARPGTARPRELLRIRRAAREPLGADGSRRSGPPADRPARAPAARRRCRSGGSSTGYSRFGEELGWRGYLLPALIDRVGTWPALILSGAIWGLWHSPVILLGYNFGRTDIVGVLLMVVACVLLGILFGWLRLASGNIWPAVFAHGGLNAAGGLILVLVGGRRAPGPGRRRTRSGSSPGASWRF